MEFQWTSLDYHKYLLVKFKNILKFIDKANVSLKIFACMSKDIQFVKNKTAFLIDTHAI